MKKLIFILLFIPIQLYATKYYVKNSGNDGLTGLSDAQAWETISKINGFTFASGDTIYFNKGDVWRERLVPPRSNLLFTCYGTGAKPIICRSILSSGTGDWSDLGSNIWSNNNAAFTIDVGNLVFNDDSCGIKVKLSTDLNVQGEFWYDYTNDLIKVYSVGNPYTVYGVIECVLGDNATRLWLGQDSITYDSIQFKYAGRHGISCIDGVEYLTVKHCDFKWLGGMENAQGDGYRLGNGVELYGWGTHFLIEKNTFTQIYDAGVTFQGSTTNDSVVNWVARYNIFKNVYWPFEVSYHGTGVHIDTIQFCNNTIVDVDGWSISPVNQRSPWGGASIVPSGIIFWNLCESITDMKIKNNIVYDVPTSASSYFVNLYFAVAIPDEWEIDYNMYGQVGGVPINEDWNKNVTGYSTFNNWKAGSSRDANSSFNDPTFVNYALDSFQLDVGSPAIDAGIDLGYTTDFYGNIINGLPDIGALEYDSIEPYILPCSLTSGNTLLYGVEWATDDIIDSVDVRGATQDSLAIYSGSDVFYLTTKYTGNGNEFVGSGTYTTFPVGVRIGSKQNYIIKYIKEGDGKIVIFVCVAGESVGFILND